MGLEGLAFTDHVDIDYPGFNFMIDFEKYHKYMQSIKNKFKGRLKIIEGLEAGLQKHVIDDTNKIINDNEFDFVIGSVHLLDGVDPYNKKYYEGKTKYNAYLKYLEEILISISNFNNFDILGHLDFIIRFAPYEDRSLKYSDYAELVDMIFNKIILNGKGIEINTGSYRITDSIRSAVFDVDFLKRYKELGGEIITIGSDSHSEAFIGYKFKYYIDLLKDCGFKYTTHFEGRKAIFDAI